MRLTYVGWVGFGNLGDDAIAEAVLPPLEPEEVVYAAHGPADLRRVIRPGASHRYLLLGGGTAVGRRNWRAVVNAAGALQAWRRPWFMIGAGVEDPGFDGRNSFSGGGELARWRRTLAHFDRVTVRGPRSAELLAGVGVDADVVGDPALLLRPGSTSTGTTGALGVALGFGDDLWGHAQQRVLDAVTGAALEHVRTGGTVRLIVMNDDDSAAARHVADALPAGAATTGRVSSSAEFFAVVDGCDTLISQRLHGAVLAAAADVPVIALEYQPKCRDFMASIAQDELCLRCDTVTATGLTDALRLVDATRAARRDQISRLVAGHRAALGAELDRIRAVADGPASTMRKEAARARPRTPDHSIS
jgi:polysaccharide pyruvyl transferase WcaK-like protein